MKVVVTPNSKMPIRGLLSHPFIDEKVLDLTEMQIKRVLGFGAKVHVVSLDGIKGEITLVNGRLNTDAIKTALERVDEVGYLANSKTAEVARGSVKIEDSEPNNDRVNENPYQHMTKAQRRAAKRAEAQQKVEEPEEANDANEDAAKDNAEVIEVEEKVEK